MAPFDARKEASCRRPGGGRAWVGKYGAVEHVHEFRSNAETESFLEREIAAHVEILYGTPLLTVVVVKGGGIPERASRRVDPCGRIQHQSLGRIVAAAINVYCVQRHTWHAVHERRAEQLVCQLVRRSRYQDGHPACVGHEGSHLPVAQNLP